MMNAAKSYKINIFGDQYSIASDESEEHIKQAAQLVDSLMKEIANASRLNDGRKIAVIAALELASKLAVQMQECQAKEQLLIQQIDQELTVS